MGYPGNKWRIRDVGEAHAVGGEGQPCSGTIYYTGDIDENGKLVGLPNQFVSTYYYNGYMQIQQGQVDAYGNVTWPC